MRLQVQAGGRAEIDAKPGCTPWDPQHPQNDVDYQRAVTTLRREP